MKDYFKFEENEYRKDYYNENNQHHRLTGPAIEWCDEDKSYYINGICYMRFYKGYNELYIYPKIIKLTSEYEIYIKQNIKDLISEYNPKIKLCDFNKEQINNLPNWIKDLIIL